MTVAGPGLFDLDDLPLLSMLDEQKRAVLAASPLGGLLPGECIADLFCGAGGWGEGLHESPHAVNFAVNHSPAAIATHRANNPNCSHHMGFRDDFVWPKTKRDTVRMIGNAVSPCHARALIGAAMPGLLPPRKAVAV